MLRACQVLGREKKKMLMPESSAKSPPRERKKAVEKRKAKEETKKERKQMKEPLLSLLPYLSCDFESEIAFERHKHAFPVVGLSIISQNL